MQGHEAWIQDVCFGANKKWIVTCAKVVDPCNTIQGMHMLTQPALLSAQQDGVVKAWDTEAGSQGLGKKGVGLNMMKVSITHILCCSIKAPLVL